MNTTTKYVLIASGILGCSGAVGYYMYLSDDLVPTLSNGNKVVSFSDWLIYKMGGKRPRDMYLKPLPK